MPKSLSGTGGSQCDSRESIRANHSQFETPIFIARQADSPESLEFPIRANHPIRANRANRFGESRHYAKSYFWSLFRLFLVYFGVECFSVL